jgi:hypothetical protein
MNGYAEMKNYSIMELPTMHKTSYLILYLLSSQNPEILNSDPFGEGWIVKFKSSDPSEYEDLLSAEDYEKITGEE